MAIEFQCPHCGQMISAPEEAAGATGACRFCGATIVSPRAPGMPAELVTPGDTSMIGGAPGSTPGSAPDGDIDPMGVASETWSFVLGDLGSILAAFWVAVLIAAAVIGRRRWP